MYKKYSAGKTDGNLGLSIMMENGARGSRRKKGQRAPMISEMI